MSKDKKSKINKMEKLRQMLDDPYNPKIKKLVSNDNKNFQSIHKRLSGAPSVSKTYRSSSEFLVKKSDNQKPRVTIHTKEEKLVQLKTKQSMITEQTSDAKNKLFEKNLFDGKDLYEIEKVHISEPEFLKVKLKEEKIIEKIPEFEEIEEKTEPSTSPEIKINEETPHVNKKDKMMVFHEIEIIDKKTSDSGYKTGETSLKKFGNELLETNIDEINRKTKREEPSLDKIQMYRPMTIIEMWIVTIILGVVAVSGLFLIRDWLFLNFGVYGGKFILTPEGTQNIHIWFGFAFALFGLFHLIIHFFSKKKDILPKQTLQDFKAFLHSGMYLIGLARKEDYRDTGRFTGRQRITYVALVYILGLTTITGVLQYLNFLSPDLTMVHIIPAGLSIMVLLFHFLITLRKHDFIALKSTFFNGKIPRWYIRKNHPIMYRELAPEKSTSFKSHSALSSFDNKMLIQRGNSLDNAVFKFALLLNENPDENIIKAISERLQNTRNPDEIQRIINLAEQLEDNTDKEDNQDIIDEPKTLEKAEGKTGETKEQ